MSCRVVHKGPPGEEKKRSLGRTTCGRKLPGLCLLSSALCEEGHITSGSGSKWQDSIRKLDNVWCASKHACVCVCVCLAWFTTHKWDTWDLRQGNAMEA